MNSHLNFRELLGGRNSFNLGPYLFFSPVMIIVNPIAEASFTDRRNFALWLFASFISFLVLILVIYIFQITLTKNLNFTVLPVWTIFAVAVIASTSRALTTAGLAHYLDLTSQVGVSPATSIARGILIGSLVVPIFGVLSNYVVSIKSKRMFLMEKLLILKSINFESQASLQRVRQGARESIESEYSLLISETKKQILNAEGKSLAEQYDHIANALTYSAEDLIRPLSHRLMEEKALDVPDPSLPKIFLLALRNPVLPLLPIQILAFISTAAVVSREVTSVTKILILCFIQISLMSIQALSIRILLRKYGSRKKQHFGLVAMALSTGISLWMNKFLVELFYQDQFVFFQPAPFLLSFFWWLGIFIIVSFTANLSQSDTKSEEFISELIESNSLDQLLIQKETSQVRQDIARYLHGNLQSRVMALGLSLQVTEVKDQKNMDSVLTIAHSLLDSPFSELISTEERSLSDEVAFNISRWDGLLKIDSHIEIPDSGISPIQIRAVGAAIEEALANALRHGLAKEIGIRIFEDGIGLTLSIQDDGIGPRNTPPGLGSRLFDTVATRGWSLKYRPDDLGSIVELKF
jgi:two-component sensor histidine kinase